MSISQKSLIKRLHNSIVLDCLQRGVTEANQIRKLADQATGRISVMTIAGIKAAQTKKQQIA